MESDGLSEEHIAILQAMTPEQKLRAANNLYWTAWKLKSVGIRMQHPDWSEEKVEGGCAGDIQVCTKVA
jgi:hypothetical protein